MRVIGYLRVSTREQADEGFGLDAQRAAISSEAERRGWDVVWIEDDGYTARRDDRPGLQTALTMLRKKQAQALVVSKLDRLSRSVQHFAAFLSMAMRQRWSVVALDPGIDMTTANGELVANVLMSVAQWESRINGERTSAAMAEAKASGARFGRQRMTPDTVVRRIVLERNSGRTYADIARDLSTTGVRTPEGKAVWQPSTVRRIYKAAQKDVA